MLCRRAMFVVLDVTLAEQPVYRAMSFTMANVLSVLLLQLTQPLRSLTLNRVEVASHHLLLFTAIIMTAQPGGFTLGAEIFLFFIILPPAIAYAAAFVYVKRRDNKAAELAAATAAAAGHAVGSVSHPDDRLTANPLAPEHSFAGASASGNDADGGDEHAPRSPSHAHARPVELPAIELQERKQQLQEQDSQAKHPHRPDGHEVV